MESLTEPGVYQVGQTNCPASSKDLPDSTSAELGVWVCVPFDFEHNTDDQKSGSQIRVAVSQPLIFDSES